MSHLYGNSGVGSTSATLACDCLAHRFGNASDHGARERRAPTDMSDAEWAVVRPLLPVPGWLRGRGGAGRGGAIVGLLPPRDAGRDPLPGRQRHEVAGHACHFPPWDRVYAFFRRWRNHDLVREFHNRLRHLVRERAGRDSEPGASAIDSQSVKADAVVGPDSRGFDGGKRLLALVWADGGYTGSLVEYCLPALALVLAIVKRSDDMRGFVALPKRLRAFHRQRGGDGLLVDDDAHDPPRCPATSFASVNRAGAGSINQPRAVSRLAFDRRASTFPGTESRPKQAAISWHVTAP